MELMDTDADFGMKSAVVYGLSQPDSVISQQTQWSCPSGNCTWDIFRSLAICSGCNDLTNKIEKRVSGVRGLRLSTALSKASLAAVAERVTQYRLPNGLTGDSSIRMTAYGTGNETASLSFSSHDTLIWSMTMMNFTNFSGEEEPTTNATVSAIECGLWYCVNGYKSTVKDGNLVEIFEPAPSKREPDSWRSLESDSFLPNDINYNLSAASAKRTDLQLGEGFNLSQAAIFSISDLMYDTFTTTREIDDGDMRINANVLASGPDVIMYTPTAMQSLYNSQDLKATFATLAKSMTNEIRRNSDGKTVVNGKEGKYIVVIKIRGWFLALPGFLIVNGAIFLTIVVHHTNKSKVAFWGTNTLPILALGGKLGPIFDDNDIRPNKMGKYAKRQLVQFSSPEQQQQQPGDNFDRVSITSQHEDYEMISPLRTPVKQQGPSTGEVSIVSDNTYLIEEEERQQQHIPDNV